MLRRILIISLICNLFIVQTPPANAFPLVNKVDFSSDKIAEKTEQVHEYLIYRYQNIQSLRYNILSRSEQLLKKSKSSTKKAYKKTKDIFDEIDLLSLVIGASVSEETVINSLKDVPKDFTELLKEMPAIARKAKYAGVRRGEKLRSNLEAFKLFKKIPGSVLMESNQQKVKTWLKNKHGSHIQSKANGGGNHSDNIFWELGTQNMARGAKNTTRYDLFLSRIHNATESVIQNSTTIAKLGLKATATAVLIDALVETTVQLVELSDGEMDINEFFSLLQTSVKRTAISAVAFYTLLVIAISLCPELVPVLYSPEIVAISQVILGSRLALPLLKLVPAL
ncbi:MAG: hypothetical protein WBA77_02475 [Microcoleaceae cyanobacterium]